VLTTSSVVAQQKPETAWLIYPDQQNSPALEIWARPSLKQEFVWRLVTHEHTVLAEMREPPLPMGFSFNQGQCKIEGKLRHDVIAMVKHSEAEQWSKHISRVWVANPLIKSFATIRTRRVVCLNEGWGV
jgi:hypothetical protein